MGINSDNSADFNASAAVQAGMANVNVGHLDVSVAPSVSFAASPTAKGQGVIQRLRQAIDPVGSAKRLAEAAEIRADSLASIAGKLEAHGIPAGYSISMAYEIQQGAEHLGNLSSILNKAEQLLENEGEVPSPEFCERFRAKAQSVSDDVMQEKWARLLAQEARDGGTFSPRSLAVLESMSRDEAQMFERLCSVCTGGFTSNGTFVSTLCYLKSDGAGSHSYWGGTITDREIREMVSMGLVTSGVLIKFTQSPNISGTYFVGGRFLEIRSASPAGIDGLDLTDVGTQLSRLCHVGSALRAPGLFESFAAENGYEIVRAWSDL